MMRFRRVVIGLAAAPAPTPIPHHGRATVMADLALSKATDSQVKQLATDLKKAQAPEVVTMSGWLSSCYRIRPARPAACPAWTWVARPVGHDEPGRHDRTGPLVAALLPFCPAM
jgi:hypothetical protein